VFSLLNEDVPFQLSWSHYLQLMRIENANERNFYEIEAVKSNWSVRTLQRQYNSSLYERLALSKCNCKTTGHHKTTDSSGISRNRR